MSKGFDVAVMHDFFVDRLVHTDSIPRLAESVVRKANQGGGGIHGVSQQDVRGGNAVNLAHALARLGLRTLLITHSDGIHERMLREPFEGLDAVVRVKPKPPGLTVAFEGDVNVMLGHGGGAENFGPDLLDSDDWKALRGARVICSVNWAANRSGTRLLADLRGRLGREKVIFFDPADFRDRLQEFTSLLTVIMKKRLVDWMSLNEHEAVEAARALGVKTTGLGGTCAAVAERLRVGLDVHTARESFSSNGGVAVEVRTEGAKVRRLTGAGDVWNAGSIYCRLKSCSAPERLRFANAAARLYLTAGSPMPPRLEDVLDALR
ncbi:MAG: carbohydrate kinase family protein [Nitrososphaerales archaeon]